MGVWDAVKKATATALSNSSKARQEGARRIQRGEGKKNDVYGEATRIAAEHARQQRKGRGR